MAWLTGTPIGYGFSQGHLEALQQCFDSKRVFFLCTNRTLDRRIVDKLYVNQISLFGEYTESEELPEMVLILDNSGGDIGAAYLIAKLLHNHCSRLTIVVPRWAKSAATLLCLAADELVLTDVAELGPVDPQIRRPGETITRPVLDEYTALDALRQESLQGLHITLAMLAEATGMDTKDLIIPACTFISTLMAPVYSQVKPFVYGSHMRTMKISKEYVKRILRRQKKLSFAPKVNLSPDEIAERITTAYPCHDFILDISELENLGLPVRRVTAEEEYVIAPLVGSTQKVDLIGILDLNEDMTFARSEVEAGLDEAAGGLYDESPEGEPTEPAEAENTENGQDDSSETDVIGEGENDEAPNNNEDTWGEITEVSE